MIRLNFGILPLGLCVGKETNARDKAWNKVILTEGGFCDFHISHHYHSSKTRGAIKTDITKALRKLSPHNTFKTLSYPEKWFTPEMRREIKITEWSWSHGSYGTEGDGLGDVGQPYYLSYFNDFPKVCAELGIKDTVRHVMATTDKSNLYTVIQLQ